MTIKYYFRQGTTEPITMTLKDGTSAANITGYSSVSIFLRSADGAVESEASTADSGITVTTAASGIIALNPALLTNALLFSKERYFGYIVVVDGSSKRTTFPSNDQLEFIMLERFSGDG